jgi:hypothetical protein
MVMSTNRSNVQPPPATTAIVANVVAPPRMVMIHSLASRFKSWFLLLPAFLTVSVVSTRSIIAANPIVLQYLLSYLQLLRSLLLPLPRDHQDNDSLPANARHHTALVLTCQYVVNVRSVATPHRSMSTTTSQNRALPVAVLIRPIVAVNNQDNNVINNE